MSKKRMTVVLIPIITSLIILVAGSAGADRQAAQEECTIGAAVGSATADGRPMIWKTRDWSEINNEIFWNQGEKYHFLSVGNAGSPNTLMGLNECGFAILNSVSSDLPRGSGPLNNATMQSLALGTCATIEEFEALLKQTDATGRSTQANFAVMDSTGRAAIFETAGNEYWKYEAGDPRVAPEGYVLRTNFAMNGGGRGGIERYNRTTALIPDLHADGGISYFDILRTQMRDFSDQASIPVELPISGSVSGGPDGYWPTSVSICRSSSVSAAVFHGVRAGEPAISSTMWTLLGQPATTITVPYWAIGDVPPEANGPRTAPLCDEANRIRAILFGQERFSRYINTHMLEDGQGGGLWRVTFAAEDSIFTATDLLLDGFRRGTISRSEMLEKEHALADYAWRILKGWQPD
ncbi:hypothetical protein ACFL44_00520 [Gemmatimonadota bacterium]